LRHNPFNSVTVGIWHVWGPLGSAVLKVVSPRGEGAAHWPASEEPMAWNYWAREAVAYRSGFADAVYDGSGIRPPTLLAAEDRSDGSIALWLEDVAGLPGPEWTVERMGQFARQLGQAQGTCALGPWPAEGWLSKGFLRDYTASRPVVGDERIWEHPVVQAAWSAPLRDRLRRWVDRRDALVDMVAALPRTVCHLDVWPANLAAMADESILLDWAFVGDGAVGEDAGNLVPDCVFDGFFPADALPDLTVAVEESYVGGLADAGWRDGPTARTGMRASGAAKYWWLAPYMLTSLAAGHGTVATYGAEGTVSIEERLADRRPVLEMLVDWGESALQGG
jgi:hypothetical protein